MWLLQTREGKWNKIRKLSDQSGEDAKDNSSEQNDERGEDQVEERDKKKKGKKRWRSTSPLKKKNVNTNVNKRRGEIIIYDLLNRRVKVTKNVHHSEWQRT